MTARSWIPRLLAAAIKARRPALLATALALALPPLGLLTAAVLAGAAAGTALASLGLLSTWALAPWLLALGAIPCSVLIGLKAGQAPASAYRAMARAPILIVGKALGIRRVLTFRGDTWVRTERAGSEADDRS